MQDENDLRLAAFESALKRLKEALAQPKTEWTRDAAIQRFEFTFELAWKTAKRLAREQGMESVSPRHTLKEAFKLGWVPDDRIWMDMLEDRNRTSHTYKEQVAEEIYGRLSSYANALTGLLQKLKAENSANP